MYRPSDSCWFKTRNAGEIASVLHSLRRTGQEHVQKDSGCGSASFQWVLKCAAMGFGQGHMSFLISQTVATKWHFPPTQGFFFSHLGLLSVEIIQIPCWVSFFYALLCRTLRNQWFIPHKRCPLNEGHASFSGTSWITVSLMLTLAWWVNSNVSACKIL